MKDITLAEYIENFLNIVQGNSLRNLEFNGRPPIDWKSYRENVLTEFKRVNPSSIDDADAVIRYALKNLEDGTDGGHSHIPGKNIAASNVEPLPHGKFIKDVGYVCLPHFSSGNNTPEASLYAETLQKKIAELDQSNPRGWIVDLRINYGGNLWPMLAGIGPLLGNGTHIYSMGKNHHEAWEYRDGAALAVDGVTCTKGVGSAVETPYHLKKQKPPIAILTGDGTCSSGEAILIAFRGLPNVKSFGDDSYGNSTVNIPFPLDKKDYTGKVFVLATAIMADRNKVLYGSRIKPDFNGIANISDEKIREESYTPENDPLVEQAIAWINLQLNPGPGAEKSCAP